MEGRKEGEMALSYISKKTTVYLWMTIRLCLAVSSMCVPVECIDALSLLKVSNILSAISSEMR